MKKIHLTLLQSHLVAVAVVVVVVVVVVVPLTSSLRRVTTRLVVATGIAAVQQARISIVSQTAGFAGLFAKGFRAT